MDRIATAALELMEVSGTDGATIAEIVKRAGASVGSFYARFSGKEALVRYLQARVWTEARERWDSSLQAEVWEGLPMEKVVEGVVGLLLRSMRSDDHRRRVLGRERRSDPEAMRLRLSFQEHVLATVTPLLLSRREEITHPTPEFAIRFAYRAVVGAMREFLELHEAHEQLPDPVAEVVPPEELGPELARFWIGYLNPGFRAAAGPPEGGVDFFDPWG